MTRKNEPAQKTAETKSTVRPVNRYLARIASRFGLAKYVVLLVCVLFFVFMISVYSDSMTYANLRYLLKDFNPSQTSVLGSFDQAYYEKQQNMSFTLFRSQLAVAGNARLNIYDSGSSDSTGYSLNYSGPMMLSSDKYLLCYDLGGTSYSVYTSLANVVNEKTDNEITGCAMGKNGSYALITRSSSAKYQVELWNESLKREATYYVDDYCFGAAISEDGQKLAILSSSMETSNLNTKLRVATVGRDQYDAVVSLGDVMPLKVHFFSDDRYVVLCDNEAVFYSEENAPVATIPFSALSHAYAGRNGLCLVMKTNVVASENDVWILDTSGQTALRVHAPFKIQSVTLDEENAAYFLSSGKVYLYQKEQWQENAYSGTAVSLLVSKPFVYLCRNTNVLTWSVDEEGGFHEYRP